MLTLVWLNKCFSCTIIWNCNKCRRTCCPFVIFVDGKHIYICSPFDQGLKKAPMTNQIGWDSHFYKFWIINFGLGENPIFFIPQLIYEKLLLWYQEYALPPNEVTFLVNLDFLPDLIHTLSSFGPHKELTEFLHKSKNNLIIFQRNKAMLHPWVWHHRKCFNGCTCGKMLWIYVS